MINDNQNLLTQNFVEDLIKETFPNLAIKSIKTHFFNYSTSDYHGLSKLDLDDGHYYYGSLFIQGETASFKINDSVYTDSVTRYFQSVFFNKFYGEGYFDLQFWGFKITVDGLEYSQPEPPPPPPELPSMLKIMPVIIDPQFITWLMIPKNYPQNDGELLLELKSDVHIDYDADLNFYRQSEIIKQSFERDPAILPLRMHYRLHNSDFSAIYESGTFNITDNGQDWTAHLPFTFVQTQTGINATAKSGFTVNFKDVFSDLDLTINDASASFIPSGTYMLVVRYVYGGINHEIIASDAIFFIIE